MELVQQIIAIQEKKREKVTFRGADIVATFNGKVIGTIDPISYSVSRERSPIYTLGATPQERANSSLRLSNESSIRTMREARQAGARGLTAQAFWFDEFNDDE
ncbi:hypothetical protein COM24_07710 [Bacillus toyonensis]|uniref:hypothetical protein n=1 Tax=Bacillus toyonensis TaxID=155322 RepID=UPI000BF7C540|nr:hypothetical protein [Bacillus toyonensis]PGC56689.1 hypothetical protein COM24_07710 [Bacillus toyonensis]HDX9674045.1 hypothetical protein [Bacillus cereus]